MATVSIIQRRLTDYRVPLFNKLRSKLAGDGVNLRLLHGSGTAEESRKGDTGHLAWAESLPTRYLLDDRLCWQPFREAARGSDLVVITQENKLVNNLGMLFLPRNFRLAFWGHGANLQSDSPHGIKERFKRITTNRVDWWYAYTGMSVNLVAAQGFPRDRITNLENAIDTGKLRDLCAAVTTEQISALRQQMGAETGPMALFLGSLYKEKRLEFLLAAGRALNARLPGFKLVVVGDGPQRSLIESVEKNEPWLFYAGRQTGREKAAYLRAADVILNPGLVGLGILDSFVAGTPMFTTDCNLHSPEIAYLVNGQNGQMTADDLDAYVSAVALALKERDLLAALRAGCDASARHYTIENMAENFRVGIQGALACR